MSTKHIIQNYQELALNKQRKDALAILEAGYKAVDTGEAVRRSVKLEGSVLTIQSRRYDLDKFERVVLVGIGKASYEAAVAIEKIMKARLQEGIVLDVQCEGGLKNIQCFDGTHPLPSEKNTRATAKIIDLVNTLGPKDLLLTIVSGGGSALLCQPYKMRCGELVMVTRSLMNAGATIEELNTVRKHLSVIQGGRLARMAHPATVVGLIFSDVPGNGLTIVASGPTAMDNTTIRDAAKVLSKYKIMKTCPIPGCDLLETPKDPIFFKKVSNFLVVTNRVAVKAMQEEAKKRGYKARVYSVRLVGEAREVGKDLAKAVREGEALIAAGETTVTVKGSGKGGRNQELALGALVNLPDKVLVSSVASDGIDFTPIAGAIADEITLEQVKNKKLDPDKALQNNNAYPFWQKTGSAIVTGDTGINVSDLMLALK